MTTIPVTKQRFSDTASANRKGEFTPKHISVLTILNRLRYSYLSEQVIHCDGEVDGMGRPVSYKVDVLMTDPRVERGVILVDGECHGTLRVSRKDERRDERLKAQGLWSEHLENANVNEDNVKEILARHRIKERWEP